VPLQLTRRELCVAFAAVGGSALLGCRSNGPKGAADSGSVSFDHGVASFDPTHDGVLLWTRVTGSDEAVELDYVIARDPDLGDIVDKGSVTSDPSADHTVVVDVSGLDDGSTYFYAFSGAGARTETARFRTIPSGAIDALRLGIVCCSNLAFGFFAAYAEVARRNDLDAVLHLGDYIYEYGPGTYDDPKLPRAHEPPHEALTLQDYRQRYAQYRRDPDLQELHRQHSMLSIWDDHEFADDAYLDGANDHQRDEGSWTARREAAAQACLEWVPRRVRDDGSTYRATRIGDLADLVLLDARMVGREKQPGLATSFRDSGRQLLGADQETFVAQTLGQSALDDVPWRIIGQQVMVAPLTFGGQVVNPDQWDGYPVARSRFLDVLEQSGDCVVLTGDIHSSWALDIPRDPAVYDPVTGSGSVAVEIVAPGVTSPAIPGVLGPLASDTAARLVPHVRFAELKHRGFVVLDVDRERVQADWYHLDDVDTREREARFATSFLARAGSRHLVPAEEPLPARSGPERAP
jgi:alkaline phosphatase D